MEPMKQRAWQVGTAVGVLLAVFLLAVSIKEIKSIKYVGNDTPTYTTITVNGKGEAVAIPDIATFSFSVTEKADTVEKAQAMTTEKTNSALDAIKAQGVAEKDIKTLSYSINPSYEYTQGVCNEFRCLPGKSVLTGYEVSQTIEIKVRELANAGKLFETIGSLGVQNVAGLSFSVDDIDTVKAEARTEAIANAKEKADKIAKDLGVKIVRIIGFYDSSDDPVYPYAMGYGADMAVKSEVAQRAPEIPQGEQTYISNVSVTYEIK
jgi:uncharacterized protein